MSTNQLRRSSNYRDSHLDPYSNWRSRHRPPPTTDRPLVSTRSEYTLENHQDEVENKALLKSAYSPTLSDSGEAKRHSSDDDSDPERPRKKRAMSVDGLQDTSLISLPGPHTPRWSNPDPYTSIPPASQQTNDRVDIVKLIRNSRPDNAAKAGETNEVKENLDFISLGMVSESEPHRNAPENALNIPLQRQTDGESISPVPRERRIRRGTVKYRSRNASKLGSRYNRDGSVIKEWRPLSQETGTPWLGSTPPSLPIKFQLDYEILSFYNWAKPQDFENIVRRDLVERLKAAFHSRYSGIEIHAFGSFASGVHLSTADIDLVLLSDSFRHTGVRSFGEKKGELYAISDFLKSIYIAVPDSIECFAYARVPIVKFVDSLTGLCVDMSFDNNSGLIVAETFQHLSKQPTQATLGSILMDFFNFYGDKFRYDQVAICLNPPGYFSKKSFGNPNRLTIEDPNDTYNDISSGARATDLIFRTFAGAHTTLKNCLESLTSIQSPNKSILGSIIAANFDRYTEQRNQLRRVFVTEERFAKHRMSPSPPSESWHVSAVHSAPPPLPIGLPNTQPPWLQCEDVGTTQHPNRNTREPNQKTILTSILIKQSLSSLVAGAKEDHKLAGGA
ncbi:hypothetical protein N7513_008758 [Penicillium frequentans]|nr:hypothetical protein N7513_008758 [Penicillium glabrum]